jgi:hypothetical protein
MGAADCGQHRQAAGVVAEAVIRSVQWIVQPDTHDVVGRINRSIELIVQPGAKDAVGEMGVPRRGVRSITCPPWSIETPIDANFDRVGGR